jgi:type IV secretory pathway TraG/TraD family ATPase VirD4
MADLLHNRTGPFPCLTVLDEFYQLGVLKVIGNIMGVGAGFNIKLFPILQDLNQLIELYPSSWKIFLGGAGAQIFFAPRESTTAKEISEICGITKVEQPSKSVSCNLMAEGERAWDVNCSTSFTLQTRPLYHPHEMAAHPGNGMFVFGENIPGVIRAGRKPYWLMPECRSKASPNPYPVQKKGGYWL